MKKNFFTFIFILLVFLNLTSQSEAENAIDIYLDDFYKKSSKASEILKDIEATLKEGSRENVCSRQREAAKLGLLANESLVKAFELQEQKIPIKTIEANQQRWESLLNDC